MAVNTDIFLGSGASLTFVPEVDLCLTLNATGSHASESHGGTQLTVDENISDNILLVPNLYVGCVLDLYDAGGSTTVSASTHIVTENTTTTLTISPAHTITTVVDNTDFAVIRSYGAPCPGEKSGATIRLNADNWLGLVETGAFPNVEVEMKQLNLGLGGSRNFTHQYKGIKTASGGNINLVANHAAWLYYALGQCTNVNCSFIGYAPASNFIGDAVNLVYIDSNNAGGTNTTITDGDVTTHVNTGPIFYRSGPANKVLLPPVLKNSDTYTNLEQLIRTTSDATSVTNAITYTFTELNSEDLPSFALEQSLAKDPTTLTTQGAVKESNTFVRVARGNRVNTLTLTANENEEVKMTMDLNTRAVYNYNGNTTTEVYEARAGQSTNSSLFNFAPSTDAELLEPFFFSSGSFNIFGQQFLKITALSLTINNNLMDKRFVGMGSKEIKSGLPAQRTYELTFTGIVTDDKLFQELFTETEVASGTSTIDLQFDKQNATGDDDEQIAISFKDYHLTASNWTVPEDKGPITVDATVMPRNLNTCTVKTHWVLQG
jgi:hypothetical protein